MSGEDREKERLRATPLFTSSSEVQDTLSFINVGSCYWLPCRLLGKEERKMKKKKKERREETKKPWETPRRGPAPPLINA